MNRKVLFGVLLCLVAIVCLSTPGHARTATMVWGSECLLEDCVDWSLHEDAEAACPCSEAAELGHALSDCHAYWYENSVGNCPECQ